MLEATVSVVTEVKGQVEQGGWKANKVNHTCTTWEMGAR